MKKSFKLIYIIIPILIFLFIISYNSFSTEKEDKIMVASTNLINEDNLSSSNYIDLQYNGLEINEVNNNINQNQYDLHIFNTANIFHSERIDKKDFFLEQIKVHTVKKGENLWSIANKYGIDIDTLIGANDISNMNEIRPGEKINILPIKGILYNLSPGENLSYLANKFNIDIEKIIEVNHIQNPDKVREGTTLLLPGAVPEFSYKDRLEQMLIQPVYARISSYYGMRWGRMHEGIDYAVNIGTSVKSAGSGTVVYSGRASGYGLLVIIQHQKGLKTLYAHNSKLLVDVGDYVRRGEIISKSGNTGNSTGPHLHFEVQVNGRPANPINYLRDN